MAEVDLALEPLPGTLAQALRAPAPDDGAVRAYWLQQAGFVIAHGQTRVVIDPYLSDFLARKYAGQEFAHRRLVPPPIDPGELTGLSAILCTHRHSDHMDPEALPVMAAANPGAHLVLPVAHRARVLDLGVPEAQLRPLDAGERLATRGLVIEALPSAHEDLARDEAGHALFLGYVLRLGGLTLYHSGDCVPYPGLAERLREAGVDVAFLPINGRDAYRASRGVPGNFHLEEATALCDAAGIQVLVGHHYGLFEFNTVDPAAAAYALATEFVGGQGILARAGTALRLAVRPGAPQARSRRPENRGEPPSR